MSVTAVNVNSRISNNNYDQARAFVNKSDAEIWMYANKASHDESEKKNAKRRLKFGLIGLPAAVFASAVSSTKACSKNLLSKKLFAGTKALGVLTGVSAVLTAAFTGEAIAIHNHPSIKKFHKKHPVAAELLDLFVGFEAVDLAFALGVRGLRKAGNKFPEAKEHAKASIESVAETLDKSSFNKKTMRTVEKSIKVFSRNHSFVAKALKGAVKFSPFIVVGGVLGASVSAAQKQANKRDAIFNSMKHAQMETSKGIISKLEESNKKLIDVCNRQRFEDAKLKRDLEDAKSASADQNFDKPENKVETGDEE